MAARHLRRWELEGVGGVVDVDVTAEHLLATPEAERTRSLGAEHADQLDVEYAIDVDRFDFAMEVITDEFGRKLETCWPDPR
ncbi:MAG: hypothetical protein AB8G26_08730 [Ilumatobacter sp.]